MLIMGFQVLSLESQVFVQNALFVNTPTFALAPQTHQSKKTLKNKDLIALRSKGRHSTTELFPQTGRDYRALKIGLSIHILIMAKEQIMGFPLTLDIT